jgi:membrane protein DedA with SNARE-associated domain
VDALVNALEDVAGTWGYVIVFAATALEASAFVGLLVPGETTLLLAGFLVQRGDMDLWPTMAAAAAGAIIGDSIGYEIGRHLGDRLLASRAGRWIGTERVERGRDFLQRHGPSAIFTGRFIGVLRAIVPALAGDARVPYGRFLFWNALGGIAWAPGMVLLGGAVGASYDVVGQWMGRVGLGLVAVGAIAWFVWKRLKKRGGGGPGGSSGGARRASARPARATGTGR